MYTQSSPLNLANVLPDHLLSCLALLSIKSMPFSACANGAQLPSSPRWEPWREHHWEPAVPCAYLPLLWDCSVCCWRERSPCHIISSSTSGAADLPSCVLHHTFSSVRMDKVHKGKLHSLFPWPLHTTVCVQARSLKQLRVCRLLHHLISRMGFFLYEMLFSSEKLSLITFSSDNSFLVFSPFGSHNKYVLMMASMVFRM